MGWFTENLCSPSEITMRLHCAQIHWDCLQCGLLISRRLEWEGIFFLSLWRWEGSLALFVPPGTNHQSTAFSQSFRVHGEESCTDPIHTRLAGFSFRVHGEESCTDLIHTRLAGFFFRIHGEESCTDPIHTRLAGFFWVVCVLFWWWLFSCQIVFKSLLPHGLGHTRLPVPYHLPGFAHVH